MIAEASDATTSDPFAGYPLSGSLDFLSLVHLALVLNNLIVNDFER